MPAVDIEDSMAPPTTGKEPVVKTAHAPKRRRRGRRLALIALAALVVLVAAVKYVAAPWMIRTTILERLSAKWNGPLEIANVDFNYFGPSQLRGLTLRDAFGRTWATVDCVKFRIASAPWNKPIFVEDVEVIAPTLQLHTVKDMPWAMRPQEIGERGVVILHAAVRGGKVIRVAGAAATMLGDIEVTTAAEGEFQRFTLWAKPSARMLPVTVTGLFRQVWGGMEASQCQFVGPSGPACEPFDLKLDMGENGPAIAPFVIPVGAGRVEGELASTGGLGRLNWHGRLAARHVPVAALTDFLANPSYRPGGTVNGTLDIGGEGMGLASLHGRLDVAASDTNLTVFRIVMKAFNKLGIQIPPAMRKFNVLLKADIVGPKLVATEARICHSFVGITIEPGGSLDASTLQVDLTVAYRPLKDLADASSMPILKHGAKLVNLALRRHVICVGDDPETLKITDPDGPPTTAPACTQPASGTAD